MQGEKPDAIFKCSSAVPVAALGLAIFLGPMTAVAQSSSESRREPFQDHSVDSSERRKRDAADKHERTQAQQRDAAARRQREAEERRLRDADDRRRRETMQRERPPARNTTGQQAAERERANERQAAERRERFERQEILRRQDAMRRADEERAATRRQQDARRADDMQRRDASRQDAQPASRGPYSLPDAYGTPAPSSAPRYAASRGTTCSAHPTCPAENGYGNVCNSVSRSYSDSGAAATGMQDIVSRCRTANAPDPCGAKSRQIYGGCAQQCASVARCTATAAR